MAIYSIGLNRDHQKVATAIKSAESFADMRADAHHLVHLGAARNGNKSEKLKLLSVLFQGHPNDDGTIKGSKRMARTYFFDIDSKEEADRVFELVKGKEAEYGLLFVERSVNGGAHLVGKRPWGKTILEAQCELALKLQCELDCNNKDPMRNCFCTSASPEDMVYVSPELFCDEFDAEEWAREEAEMAARQEDVPEGAHSNDKHFRVWEHNWPSHGIIAGSSQAEGQPSAVKAESSPKEALGQQANRVATHKQDFNGMPYSDIIAKYWEMYNNGNTPTEGGRNSLTYELAANLAPLCDYSQAWLEEVIPLYDGLPEDEWKSTIASALSQPRKGMPFRTRKVLEELKAERRMMATGGTGNIPPLINFSLPASLKAICKHTPAIYIPTVCEGVFPALAAHLHGVKTPFIDGKEYELAFLNFNIGEMSSGKGSEDKPIEYILKDIETSDRENRKREAEWKQQNPSAKQKKTARPEDICVQILMPDATVAAFNQRLIDAHRNGERVLYISVPEAEALYALCGKKTINTIFKLAWDRAKDGQERFGPDSVTGAAPLRLNFNAKTTPSKARKMIGPYVWDGTLSRLNINTVYVPEDDNSIPKFGRYDEKYAELIAPYIKRLNDASGMIRCKKLEKLAEQMDKENKELAALYGSDAYEKLSYRANINAYKKGMVLYIMNGCKYDKSIENYVRWCLRWDLWCKFRYFADLIDKAIREDKEAVSRIPTNLLSMLPDAFTEADLSNLRAKQGMENDTSKVRNQLKKWKSRGHIDFDDTIKAYIKTGKYANA